VWSCNAYRANTEGLSESAPRFIVLRHDITKLSKQQQVKPGHACMCGVHKKQHIMHRLEDAGRCVLACLV